MFAANRAYADRYSFICGIMCAFDQLFVHGDRSSMTSIPPYRKEFVGCPEWSGIMSFISVIPAFWKKAMPSWKRWDLKLENISCLYYARGINEFTAIYFIPFISAIALD